MWQVSLIDYIWQQLDYSVFPACKPPPFFVASSHHQRPSRSCWPVLTGQVQSSVKSAVMKFVVGWLRGVRIGRDSD